MKFDLTFLLMNWGPKKGHLMYVLNGWHSGRGSLGVRSLAAEQHKIIHFWIITLRLILATTENKH